MNLLLLNILANRSGGSLVESVYPTDMPAFITPETLVEGDASVPGILFTADLNGQNDIILSGNWTDGISLNAISGVKGLPIRFSNESTGLIGTSSKDADAFGSIGAVNFIEVWGKDKDNPFRISAGTGRSGFSFPPLTGDGNIIRVYNAVAKDIGYSTVLMTNTTAGKFKKLNFSWVGVEGVVTEGENLYFGHVTTERIIEYLTAVHCYGKDKGREGVQIKWTQDFVLYNHTYRNVGQVSDTAQQHGFQFEVSNGIMYDSIFDGCKRPFNIFAHGVTIKGGYTRFTSSKAYIGDAVDFWPGNPLLNGEPILFDGHTFVWDGTGTLAQLVQVEETIADIEFRNCTFVGDITALFQDSRVSPSNSLIGTLTTNGNTHITDKAAWLASYAPSYKSANWYEKDFSNLTIGTYWFNQGVGKGSPSTRTIELLDGIESEPIEDVPFGTLFGDLDLPETGRFMNSQGNWEDFPITWAEGDYDPDADGEYTVYATPTTSYNNDRNIRIEKDLTVLPEPPDYYVALISLKGTGSSPYVSSGNWNHVGQSFATGNQTITGDNSSSTLASLRRTDGVLTGYGVNIVTQFEGNDTRGMNSAGAYPANANRSAWENPGSNGTSRSFKITGLNNSIAYTFKFLCSLDTFFNCSVDITVSGASGGGLTVNDFNANSNVNTVFTSAPVYPTSGEVTITVLKNSGNPVLNVIEINWEE